MKSYLRFILATLFFLTGGFLVPIILNYDVFSRDFSLSTNLLLIWMVVIYSLMRLSLLAIKNEKKYLELTFWAFVYIWLGVSSFSQIANNHFPWQMGYSEQSVTKSVYIVIAGILSYDFGIFVSRIRKRKQSVENNLIVTKNRLVFIIVCSTIVSMFFVFKNGGIQMLFSSRFDAQSYYSGTKMGLLISSNLIKVPPFVALLYAISYFKNAKTKNHGIVILTVLLALYNLIISNPMSNARYWFGTVALTILFMLLKWGKATFAQLVIALSSAFLIIFPYADLFRSSLSLDLQVNNVNYILTYKGDYDAFQMIVNTVSYVNDNGVDYGRQMAGALLFWVPRAIWENKPFGSGQTVGEYLNFGFTNLSSPLWAESYIFLGISGVILIFFLYGYFTQYLQYRFLSIVRGKHISITEIMLPFLAAYQIYFLRGDLLNGVAYMSVFTVMVIGLSKYRNKEVKRNRAQTIIISR